MFSQKPSAQRGWGVNASRLFRLWVKGFWPFAAQLLPHFRRVKIIRCDVQYRGKDEKLIVGHVSKPNFYLAQCRTADVQPCHLAMCGELLLAECQLASRFANLWPNHIGWMFFTGHGSTKSSLTLFEKPLRYCYARVTECNLIFRTRNNIVEPNPQIENLTAEKRISCDSTEQRERLKQARRSDVLWIAPDARTMFKIKRRILKKLLRR